MKNSSISCAARNPKTSAATSLLVAGLNLALLLAVLLSLGWAPPAEAAKKLKSYEREMLIQPFLGPGYAEWLIGPIARLADRDEAEAYLALAGDDEAKAFIAEFWARRDSNGEVGGNPARQLFEERAAEADKLYSEGQVPGRNTDRGTLHVLYGPPEEVDYDIAQWQGGPPLILWSYAKDAEPGLDGEKPARLYRLIRIDDLTVFYDDRMQRRAFREQRFRPGFPS